MIYQFIQVRDEFQKEGSEAQFNVLNYLSNVHLPHFKGVIEILLLNELQNIELKRKQEIVLMGFLEVDRSIWGNKEFDWSW